MEKLSREVQVLYSLAGISKSVCSRKLATLSDLFPCLKFKCNYLIYSTISDHVKNRFVHTSYELELSYYGPIGSHKF